MSELWLAGPLTSAAYGWRIERRDGVTLGFTSHDRDVELGGLSLRAAPGIAPSSITESLGMDVDGLDVRGALSADAICSDDLLSGKWDGARLSIFLFDWTDPDADIRILAVGELGAISHGDQGFEAEFRGPASRLDCAVAPYTSPGCRAEFCGGDCGLNAQRFTLEAVVASINGGNIMLAAPLNLMPGDYAFGRLRWLDGSLTGLRSEILSNDATSVSLLQPPPFVPAIGARVEIMQGCDKRLATCATRFANAINFRGEPFLPGNDILTRYPGAA